jgi:Uma2 family endonuclease
MPAVLEATIEDLYKVDGKAELVNGEIVTMPACGYLPNRVAFNICIYLRSYERNVENGHACTDNIGYKVDLPHRKSFSPDASFHIGQTTGMKFLEGAPVFAVEVRSENDYGKKADEAIADKRHDYFAAGTLVVWDVDLLGDDVIKSYSSDSPDTPIIYRRGDIARAELALPGWSMPVDELFS